MDLIFYNCNLKTMDMENPSAEAIAVEHGVIQAVGKNEDILPLKSPATKLIDLNGKTMIPGFNDAHLHLLGYASELNSVDLNGVKSIDEMISRIQAFIRENNVPPGALVSGSGWNQNFFPEKTYPTRYDLDKASTDHRIITDRACHHVCAVNSKTLESLGIDKNTPDMDDGEIIRGENGEPLGIFTENARRLLRKEEEAEVSQIEALIQSTAPFLAGMGITSVQSDDFGGMSCHKVHEAYRNLAKAGKLTFRVNQQCRAANFEGYQEILGLEQSEGDIAGYYKLGPIKVMADGSLGARTAYMREAYHDAPGEQGIPIYSQEELNDIALLAHESGRPLAIHAIGDGAVEMAVHAIKKARAAAPEADIRHGIVHCQITDEDQLKAFQENDIIAYIQPIFIHADWAIVPARVGKEKSLTSYAFKTLKDMCVPIPFGTDCPVESFNPFNNIYCAVTRKDLGGSPPEGYNANEALNVEDAVYAYTVYPAYASYEENYKGMLKTGMAADMAVLSKNIFAVNPADILDTTVEMTIFDGKIIYEK